MENSYTFAVIITYQHKQEDLIDHINELLTQVTGIIIVDNNESDTGCKWNDLKEWQSRVSKLSNHRNLGLAKAINQGINAAMERGAEYILLLDDDSIPDPTMVDKLREKLDIMRSRGVLVAAVGPDFYDESTSQRAQYIKIKGFRIIKSRCNEEMDKCLESDYLMTSGSLMHKDVFDNVGLMNEDLFIDYIDTEWCLRAKSHGYKFYGVCSARMQHSFGDKSKVITLPRGRKVPYRYPLRHYFIFRNAMYMLRLSYCPNLWKLNEVKRLLFLSLIYFLYSKDRFNQIHMMIRGVIHGLKGRFGPYQQDSEK